MDFFSILLSGALLTYLLMGEVGAVVLGDLYAKLAGEQAWAALLFTSYLLGHLVFLLGSWLDGIYDWFRDRTLNWQVRYVASRGRLLSWPIRMCVSLVIKRERNLALDCVLEVKEHALAGLSKDAINAFQWCKALLKVESPQSLAVVQRFEPTPSFSAASRSCFCSCSWCGAIWSSASMPPTRPIGPSLSAQDRQGGPRGRQPYSCRRRRVSFATRQNPVSARRSHERSKRMGAAEGPRGRR